MKGELFFLSFLITQKLDERNGDKICTHTYVSGQFTTEHMCGAPTSKEREVGSSRGVCVAVAMKLQTGVDDKLFWRNKWTTQPHPRN